LSEALSLGFRDARRIRDDENLSVLRGREDFRGLLLDLAFPDDRFAEGR
jgi:hypothetical protein